jgi:hypothetical protein
MVLRLRISVVERYVYLYSNWFFKFCKEETQNYEKSSSGQSIHSAMKKPIVAYQSLDRYDCFAVV